MRKLIQAKILGAALLLLFLTTGGRAQTPPPTVSIAKENVSVEQVLKEIERLTNYTFFYNNGDFDLKRIVSVAAVRKPVSEVVRQMLPDCSCRFENRRIILVKDAAPQRQTVKGVVKDEKGAPRDRRHGPRDRCRADPGHIDRHERQLHAHPPGAYGRSHARSVVHRLRHLQIGGRKPHVLRRGADLRPAEHRRGGRGGIRRAEEGQPHGSRGHRVAEGAERPSRVERGPRLAGRDPQPQRDALVGTARSRSDLQHPRYDLAQRRQPPGADRRRRDLSRPHQLERHRVDHGPEGRFVRRHLRRTRSLRRHPDHHQERQVQREGRSVVQRLFLRLQPHDLDRLRDARILLGQDRRLLYDGHAEHPLHLLHRGRLQGSLGAAQRQDREPGASVGRHRQAQRPSAVRLSGQLRLVQLPLRRQPPDVGPQHQHQGRNQGALLHGQRTLLPAEGRQPHRAGHV